MRKIKLRAALALTFPLVVLLICWALMHGLRTPAKPQPPDPGTVSWTHLANLYLDCQKYKRLQGVWPPTIIALTNIVPLSNQGDLTDGWGGSIFLLPATNSTTGAMLLITYGADHVPGGNGTNTDICYTLTY